MNRNNIKTILKTISSKKKILIKEINLCLQAMTIIDRSINNKTLMMNFNKNMWMKVIRLFLLMNIQIIMDSNRNMWAKVVNNSIRKMKICLKKKRLTMEINSFKSKMKIWLDINKRMFLINKDKLLMKIGKLWKKLYLNLTMLKHKSLKQIINLKCNPNLFNKQKLE